MARGIALYASRASALQAIAATLATQEQPNKLLELVEQEWHAANTRDYLCQLAELALPLLAPHPALTLEMAEGFGWVDGQLAQF